MIFDKVPPLRQMVTVAVALRLLIAMRAATGNTQRLGSAACHSNWRRGAAGNGAAILRTGPGQRGLKAHLLNSGFQLVIALSKKRFTVFTTALAQ